MYPCRHPEIVRNRIAELHQQADRAAVAIARGRARRACTDRSGPALPVRLARAPRRMLARDRARASAGPPPPAGDAPRPVPDTSRSAGQAHTQAPAAC